MAQVIENGWNKATVSKWVQANNAGIRWVVSHAGRTHVLKTEAGAIAKAKKLVGVK